MRVIAGQAKGKRLKAPHGLHTRPVTDRIKEALFNIWQDKVAGALFLDLFAGSGSMGIEALSRGAKQVMFVDNSLEASKIIKANLDNCGFAKGFSIHKSDVFLTLQYLKKQAVYFDIIYVDPPFTNPEIFDEIIKALDSESYLKPDGLLVIRSYYKKEMPEDMEFIYKYRYKNYGESSVHFYRLKNKEAQNNDGDF